MEKEIIRLTGIEGKRLKDGRWSIRLTVANGMDSKDKQRRKRKKIELPAAMTRAKAKKEAQKAKVEFESEIKQGFKTGTPKRFTEYANYVIDLKERPGCSRSAEYLL